jgi:hypothetical protein
MRVGSSIAKVVLLTEPLKSARGCQNASIRKRLLPLFDHPVRPLDSICHKPSGLVATPERRQDIPTTAMGMRPSPSAPLLFEEGWADMMGSRVRKRVVNVKFVDLLEFGVGDSQGVRSRALRSLSI